MYQEHQPPFSKPISYIVRDILFFVFGALYIIGDTDHLNVLILRFCKPIPLYIMISQLYPLRHIHVSITYVILALFIGSLGDILLELSSLSSYFFLTGILMFLIGHLFYVAMMLKTTYDIGNGAVTFGEIFDNPIRFVLIWIFFGSLSLLSFGTLFLGLNEQQVDGKIVLEIALVLYGSILMMLVMAGFFHFFITKPVSKAQTLAWLILIGSITFYICDSLVAHLKFNKGLIQPALGDVIMMANYYIAQFLLGKGTFYTALYFTDKEKQRSLPL